MDRNRSKKCSWCLQFVEIATRIWGIFSMIVMWGVGVDLAVHKYGLGTYILAIAVLLTFSETAFAANIFLEFTIKDEKNLCYQCWQHLQSVNSWKKAAVYLLLSFFCFLQPIRLWLGAIAGITLIILALLYLQLAYKVAVMDKEALFYDKDCSYDRFENLQDEIDDSLPELNSGNIGDQDAILQV